MRGWIVIAAFAAAFPPAPSRAQHAATPAHRESPLKILGLDLVADMPADQNAVVSPYSLAAALDLIAIGGNDAMRATLSAATDLSAPARGGARDTLATRDLRLQAVARAAGVTLELANAVWVDQTEELASGYGDSLAGSAGTSPEKLDLGSEAAMRQINAWVATVTHGHIPELLAGPPGPAAFTVGNALYFHGDWSQPFDPSLTDREIFHGPRGAAIGVDMMQRSARLPYREDPDFQAVDLSYGAPGTGAGKFSLLLLLPKNAADDPVALWHGAGARVEAALSGTGFRVHTGTVLLPRQKLDGSLDPIMALKNSAIVAAISASGALSRMFRSPPSHPRYASVQKTILSLDETGATAAAATGITVTRSVVPLGPPPFVFRADRPFLFCLREATTGTTLMLGVVRRPTG